VWLGKAQADVRIEICPKKIVDTGLKAELENQDALAATRQCTPSAAAN